MKKIVIILALISLIILIGCNEVSNYGIKEKQICRDVCQSEKLSLNYVTGGGDTLFCHCEKIISIPLTQ